MFKTTDGGVSWKAVFTREATSSIGAIAIAPSNHNFVWVGTGEANPRNDVITGKGVYFSPDAGLGDQLLDYLNQFNHILTNETPALIKPAEQSGTPTIFAGQTIQVEH